MQLTTYTQSQTFQVSKLFKLFKKFFLCEVSRAVRCKTGKSDEGIGRMRAKSGGYLGHQYFVCLFWVSGSRELLVGILSKLIMVTYLLR